MPTSTSSRAVAAAVAKDLSAMIQPETEGTRYQTAPGLEVVVSRLPMYWAGSYLTNEEGCAGSPSITKGDVGSRYQRHRVAAVMLQKLLIEHIAQMIYPSSGPSRVRKHWQTPAGAASRPAESSMAAVDAWQAQMPCRSLTWAGNRG